MDNQKIYLLAELTVLPEFLDEVTTVFKEALIPGLQEPGCEALFEISREDNPHKRFFVEIFSSPEVHEFHLEQDHTKRMFSAIPTGDHHRQSNPKCELPDTAIATAQTVFVTHRAHKISIKQDVPLFRSDVGAFFSDRAFH
jgi:quinol monooxygenase YgiN